MMALKTARVAAAVAGLTMGSLMPGVAHAADPNPTYPPALKYVSCVAGTNANGSVLRVNMAPNLKGSKYYSFTVQKQTPSGWVQVGPTHRTKGSKETRTINLKAGTYQVLCQGKYGYLDAISNPQPLRK
jgi:hypothetical protein